MAVAEEVPARRRHHARLGARILVSAVLFGILLTKIHFDDFVPPHPTRGTWLFLAAGILLMALSFVLAAWRWQRVLAVFGYHVRLRTLLKHYVAGQFVGNLLPSTIGGDVLRVSRSSADTGNTTDAFAAVVLERLTGFVVLPLLVFAGFAINPSLFDVNRSTLPLLIAGVTLVMLFVILFLAGHPKAAGRFAEHDNWMRAIGAVHVGVDRLRRDPRDAGGALLAALAYQLVVVGAVYCAFHVVDVRVPNAAVLAYVPAVAMAQVLPISIGGLGVREGLLAFLLHPLGVPTGRAVAIGLLWYGMTLLVSIAGAPAFAVGHKRRAADAPADGDVAAGSA
ncbi:MAG: flippase-like domain-containing protein, partial [Actinobacteria bacterium]|nr:flippase-like domain-containing protein [Actinomycetota bacterium]